MADWNDKHATSQRKEEFSVPVLIPAGVHLRGHPSANHIPPHSPRPRPPVHYSLSLPPPSRSHLTFDTGSKVSQRLYDGTFGPAKSHDKHQQAARAHASTMARSFPVKHRRAHPERCLWTDWFPVPLFPPSRKCVQLPSGREKTLVTLLFLTRAARQDDKSHQP